MAENKTKQTEISVDAFLEQAFGELYFPEVKQHCA